MRCKVTLERQERWSPRTTRVCCLSSGQRRALEVLIRAVAPLDRFLRSFSTAGSPRVPVFSGSCRSGGVSVSSVEVAAVAWEVKRGEGAAWWLFAGIGPRQECVGSGGCQGAERRGG